MSRRARFSSLSALYRPAVLGGVEPHRAGAVSGMLSSDGLLAAVGTLLGGRVTPAAVDRVCVQVARLLPVDGVAVTLAARGELRVTVGASDEVARRVEVAQLTVGVGPCTQATSTGVTVAVEDLTVALSRWPGLGDQLIGVPVGAIAAAPLQAGSVTIGSLDAYRRHPHRWTADELGDITRSARVLALAFATQPDASHSDRALEGRDGNVANIEDGDGLGVLPAATVDVAQATGMVMASLGISPEEALSRLRGAAFGQGRLITAVAADLITGRVPADLGDPRPVPRR